MVIDLGCMQINQHYHGEHFASIEAMFDPKQNVDYAARFLARLHARHETWSMAVARYHAGPDNDPAQKRYICRVVANMVATGFGQWTLAAREFCNQQIAETCRIVDVGAAEATRFGTTGRPSFAGRPFRIPGERSCLISPIRRRGAGSTQETSYKK